MGSAPMHRGRESEGVPQIQILSPFLAGRRSGGWSKGFFRNLLVHKQAAPWGTVMPTHVRAHALRLGGA